VSVLTARQRAILRAYGGWRFADVLIDPDRGIRRAKQSCYGSSGFRVDGEELWMNTTARGIELYRFDVDGTRQNYDVLPWSTVARFARALPARLVADIRALRAELTRCTLSHPAYPSKASSDERQRWEHDGYRPWLNRRRAIEARLEAALDVALVDEGSQPALFDLDTTVRHRPGPTRRSRPDGHRATDAGQGLLL
jgi:hypothetical protein